MRNPDPRAIEACRLFAEISGWPGAKGFILYGSRARGDYNEDSDADLAIIVEGKPENSWDELLAMNRVVWEVFDQTGIRIEPVLIGEPALENPEEGTNPPFLREIKKDGVKIA